RRDLAHALAPREWRGGRLARLRGQQGNRGKSEEEAGCEERDATRLAHRGPFVRARTAASTGAPPVDYEPAALPEGSTCAAPAAGGRRISPESMFRLPI